MYQNAHELKNVILLMRRDDWWRSGDMRRIPIRDVPVGDRCGALRVVVAQEVTAYDFEPGVWSYQGGIRVKARRIYESYVQVFSRGSSDKDYERWAKGEAAMNQYGVRRLWRTPHTPMMVSRQGRGHYGGFEGKEDANHVTFVPQDQQRLRQALNGMLPHIGVAKQDVAIVVQFIEGQLAEGKAELADYARRIEMANRQRR